MKKTNHIRMLAMTVIVLALALSGCGKKATDQGAGATGDLKGRITISGAFALYPMMQRWSEEFTKLHPDVQFDVSAGGAGKGMADALAGAVDIGMVSRAITPEEEAKGAFWVPVNKDAVFVVVNEKNPVLAELKSKGMTKEILQDIYINGKITTWGQVVGKPEITDQIHIFTRSDAAGAPETFAKYLGGKQEDLLGIQVFGDPGLLDTVVKDPLGIGYNNLNYAFDAQTGNPVAGAWVVSLDADANGQVGPEEACDTKEKAVAAVASGHYPSPPARDENLITKGKPVGLVKAFIEWILTDGQQYLSEAGYVQLPADQLTAGLQKIK